MTASWTHWQRLEWLSEDTLLVHFPNPTDVATAAQLANLVQALFADRPDWLWDVTPGFGKLLVHYRPDRIDPLTLEQALSKALGRAVAADAQETQSVIEIAVCYDPRVAPDLADVAPADQHPAIGLMLGRAQPNCGRVVCEGECLAKD